MERFLSPSTSGSRAPPLEFGGSSQYTPHSPLHTAATSGPPPPYAGSFPAASPQGYYVRPDGTFMTSCQHDAVATQPATEGAAAAAHIEQATRDLPHESPSSLAMSGACVSSP